jgi:hypothetical protein
VENLVHYLTLNRIYALTTQNHMTPEPNNMTPEIIAMLGGGLSGFVMKLIGAQMEHQARAFDRMLQKQGLADESADRASARGGVWVRRGLVAITFFAIVVAPFIVAFTDIGVSMARETNGFLGLFKGVKWDTVQGFVILAKLPEVRQTAIAIVGFYFGFIFKGKSGFGSSQIK